jgi:hypothetical protein
LTHVIIVAIALAGAVAWFSVRGMVTLSPLSVIGVAPSMESATLVTAARRATAWIWHLVLMALVAGLAVINAAGFTPSLSPRTSGNGVRLPRSSRR